MKKYTYYPHAENEAKGHIFISNSNSACTITLTGAAAMSQKQLDKIANKIEKNLNRNCDTAFELLRLVLCESGMDNENDQDIYNFLKENNELPEGYKPYWV